MNPYRNIDIADFSYCLPDDRIAGYPLPNRSDSKLLLWRNGAISEDVFKNAARYLPQNSLLVFNNTRVINARLHFRKETGAGIEILCLEPVAPADYQLNFQSRERATWQCMIGNAGKWKAGLLTKQVDVGGTTVTLTARMLAHGGDSFEVEFTWSGGVTFAQIIDHAGVLPIPPYLNRPTEPSDAASYQTLYAKIDGSVAAPTAGLHFTDEVFSRLAQGHVETREITLHVGAGTFRPVKAGVAEHIMHRETVIVPKEVIATLAETGRRVIAVGTTSVRSLESLYWLGVQIENNTFSANFPEVGQWEPYETTATVTVGQALKNLVLFMDNTGRNELQFSTQIMIAPGYGFKIISGMFTNFHQPQSTLLLLIAAFLGDDWKRVYDFALAGDFRFLSYGDSNLYIKE